MGSEIIVISGIHLNTDGVQQMTRDEFVEGAAKRHGFDAGKVWDKINGSVTPPYADLVTKYNALEDKKDMDVDDLRKVATHLGVKTKSRKEGAIIKAIEAFKDSLPSGG